MTVIMLKVIPLVFQGIKRFVFNTPPGTPGSHEVKHVIIRNRYIGDPTESLHLPFFIRLRVADDIHPEVMMSIICLLYTSDAADD